MTGRDFAGRAGLWMLLALLVPAACAPAGQPEVELRLGFVTNTASEFWLPARRGCRDAEVDLPGVEVLFRMPAHGTIAEQRQILEELLDLGVEGVALSPVDPARQTDWINGAASRLLLVTHDSDAPSSRRAFYVGSDNRAAGRMAGELIRQALPGGGRVMAFVGSLEARNAEERLRGVQEELRGSGVELVGVMTDPGDRTSRETNVLEVLADDPGIDLLLGLWASNGEAILRAVRRSRRMGTVQIVCFDSSPEILDAVASGEIYGTVVQQPYLFCRESVRLMAERLRPERYRTDSESPLLPPDSKVHIPTLVLTRDNAADFR